MTESLQEIERLVDACVDAIDGWTGIDEVKAPLMLAIGRVVEERDDNRANLTNANAALNHALSRIAVLKKALRKARAEMRRLAGTGDEDFELLAEIDAALSTAEGKP